MTKKQRVMLTRILITAAMLIALKFIPLTGVTLPFISYGGSSVMTTMIMFFIIQGIYIRLQKEGERRGGRK